MTTDPLTTTLAQIQDRVRRRDSDLSQCAAGDLTRLLGAVEAVLAAHQPEPHFCYRGRQQCANDGQEWPCSTRLAITAALLGEETATDG